MVADLYERLAEHLDSLPAGYPRTDSGVEMRILRRLFAPGDAEIALHLTLIPEEARVIARRARIPVDEASRRLEEMVEKGLVFTVQRREKPPLYQAWQFIVGFWEGQVNRLSPELVHDFEEYLPSYVDYDFWQKAPQVRTIPVGESIPDGAVVMAYEQAEALVRANTSFSVSNCICRQEMELLGERCDKPMETCLGMGLVARHTTRSGRGRAISQEEALAILKQAEDAGLVLQPANAKDSMFICTCCGCCCAVLRSAKRHPKPASIAASPFRSRLDIDLCEGCGVCETRCQTEAIGLDNGHAQLDLDRCIGCGLCVTTCPAGALSMVRKAEDEQPRVPENVLETYLQMGQARGRLGKVELVSMQVRSKVDRWLAR